MVREPVCVGAVRQLPELCLGPARVRPIELALEADGADQQERPRARDCVDEPDQRLRSSLAGCNFDLGAEDGERNPIEMRSPNGSRASAAVRP